MTLEERLKEIAASHTLFHGLNLQECEGESKCNYAWLITQLRKEREKRVEERADWNCPGHRKAAREAGDDPTDALAAVKADHRTTCMARNRAEIEKEDAE